MGLGYSEGGKAADQVGPFDHKGLGTAAYLRPHLKGAHRLGCVSHREYSLGDGRGTWEPPHPKGPTTIPWSHHTPKDYRLFDKHHLESDPLSLFSISLARLGSLSSNVAWRDLAPGSPTPAIPPWSTYPPEEGDKS